MAKDKRLLCGRGEAARQACYLALLFPGILIFGGCAGCRRATPLAAPRRYVRLDALLPLHPAWSQVASLNRAVTLLAAAPAPMQTLPSEKSPLPARFPPLESIPADLTRDRAQRVAAESNRYVARLTETLTARDNAVMERETQLANRQMETDLSAYQVETRRALSQQARRDIAPLEKEADRLRYRRAALTVQTNGNALAGPSLADAQSQLRLTDSRLLALAVQQQQRLARVDTDLAGLVTAERQRLDGVRQARLATAQQKLDTARAGELDRERQGLQDQGELIPPLGSMAPPPVSPRETPLTLPAPVLSIGATGQAQTHYAQSVTRQRAEWDAQKTRLLAAIRADTHLAVEQVFRQRGWTLVPQGTRAATDATAETASAIRAQWRGGNGN